MLSDYYNVSGHTTDWPRTDLYGYAHYHYQFALSIESRDDYLDFRKHWRQAYRELSQLIRDARTAFRRRHRSDNEMDRWRATWSVIKRYCSEHDLHDPRLEDEVLVWALKAHARFLLALLEAVKAAHPVLQT